MNELYALLPIALRGLDEAQGGPLRDLLDLLALPLAHLDEDLAQRYDDLFIETCAEWVVPYLGELVGHRPLRGPRGPLRSPRAEVARTVGYRRRKGTVGVLEQIARDLSGRPARALEAWPRLGLTQHLLNPRPQLRQSPDLRRPGAHAGPFRSLAHTADLRPSQARGLVDVALFVWRLRASPLSRVSPARVDAGRYTFSPLGDPVPLFHRPDPGDTGPITGPEQAPGPITRRRLHADLAAYYGEDRSLSIRVDGAAIPAALVDAADLRDDPQAPGAWIRAARPGRAAIDPELGRFALAPELAGDDVEVSFHVGAPDEIGGGGYERSVDGPADLELADPAAIAELAARVAELGGRGTILLRTSRSVDLAAQALTLAAGGRLVIRAAAGERPLLRLQGPLTVAGGEGAELVLEGLAIAGPLRAEGAGLRSLTLRHCTLVPGLSRRSDGTGQDPEAASITLAGPSLGLTLEASITGPIEGPPAATIAATRSIVDAGDPDAPAIRGPGGGPGPGLGLDRCTLIGGARVESIALVTDSLILGALTSARRQGGCVRRSSLGAGSQTPRRHLCLPADGDDPLAIAPRHHSLRYGSPRYALLRPDAPARLREAAADEGEPGVYHDLLLPLIEDNLRARLAEHLPLGLRAGLFFVT